MEACGYLKGHRAELRRQQLRRLLASKTSSFEAQLDAMVSYYAIHQPAKPLEDIRCILDYRREADTWRARPSLSANEWAQLSRELHVKYGATLKGAVSGCVELDEFVEIWETLTGESIDDVVAIAEAHADRQAGRSPKVDPLRDNFDAFDVDHNGTTARPALSSRLPTRPRPRPILCWRWCAT